MKPFAGYETARVSFGGGGERLPAGGYVIEIHRVTEMEYSWGSQLLLDFDIAEGEHKDFYNNNYDMQMANAKWKGVFRLNVPKGDGSEKDGWTANSFKSAIEAIEQSNAGYAWDWDETKLAGKTVGALFRDKEFEMDNGSVAMTTECFKLLPVEYIRSGKFKAPKPKLLSGSAGYTEVPPVDDNDDPWNTRA
jgi:hypothetical protein